MRILLINPPDELEAMLGVGQEFVQKYEPLGLLYIAAYLREAGHDVAIMDAYAEDLNLEDLKTRIKAHGPLAIGLSTLTCNGGIVYDLGRWIKETHPEITVILGNIHAASYAKQYLENRSCDFVVHGEGELAFTGILDSLQGKMERDAIPGISYLDDSGAARLSSPVEVIADITALPFPARDLVDQNLYRLTELSNQSYIAEKGRNAKTMITSRGCVYRCKFCVVHHSRRPRYINARRVVDELEMLQKEYNTSYVYIMDSLFMGNRKRVYEICDEIKRRKLSILWGCDTNVNFVNAEMIREMASANCYELSLGIESGVQRLLDGVDKRHTPARVVDAVNTIRNNSDINVEGLFILGLPGETYAESLETIRYAKSLPLDMAQFSILCPYPGSALFDELASKGEIDTGIRPDGTLDTSVWKRYSSYICFTDIEPIWVTPELTANDLRTLQKKALRSFYLRPRQILLQLRRIRLSNLLKTIKIAIKGFF